MLDIKFIRQNPQKVKQGCAKKQVKVDIDQLLELDKQRREIKRILDEFRAKKNKASREIAVAKTQREKQRIISEMQKIDQQSERIKKQFQKIQQEYEKLMYQVPNMPFDDVPVGQSEKDNVVIKQVGDKPRFDFKPKDYLEIAQKLDLIDVKRAAKVSGTRFGYLKNEAVLLEFALVNFVFENLLKEKFTPIVPPVMISEKSMRAMGYLEHGGERETYHFKKDKLYFVGTSEQAIGPMYMDEVLDEKELPKRFIGFSTCFRREAGSYGRDTKGILRVHQFDKLEMFSFCHPQKSRKELQFFLETEEKLMQALKIPYRVVQMCTGDLGNPAAIKYDIEAWMPGQAQYRETHSASNCTDFQARRLNIRYRDSRSKKMEFVHTVNGTAFAIGRTLITIIENYQQKDGSVLIPKVLQKYIGKNKIG